MAINYSYQLRTNKVAQTQITIGGSGVLRIYSGAEPANCAAANPSGLLCTINLPAVFMQSSGGVGTIVGNWTGTGTAAGTAASFRIFDGSNTCHIQGNCTTDLVMSTTAIAVGQPITVTGFSVTAPGEGTPVVPTTGTLAVTEASDVIQGPIRGSLALSEANDILQGPGRRATLALTEAADTVSAQATLPVTTLTKSTVNPRYLAINGNCVFCAGSHTWDDFQPEPPATLTAQQWIDNIVVPELNVGPNAVGLLRVWCELTSAYESSSTTTMLPFLRTGPGTANDTGLKWDLTKFDPNYTTALKNLITYCLPRNIHCQVMFFSIGGTTVDNNDVFNDANNINGTGVSGTGETDISSTTCLNLQKAYVTQIVTQLYNNPNVTYEVNNETHETAGSLSWTNAIIGTVHATETSLGGIRHLITQGAGSTWDGSGSTWGGSTPTFQVTQADYICSGWGDAQPYQFTGNFGDIPLGGVNGNQAVMLDTDHSLLSGTSADAVWRALTRGAAGYLHMDVGGGNSVTQPAQAPVYGSGGFPSGDPPTRLGILGVTTAVNLISSLNGMQPNDNLSSTTYCLADNTHLQYIAYQPNGGSSFTLNLSGAAGNTLSQTWIDATTGDKLGSTVNYGATSSNAQSFTPPSNGGAVGLVLSRSGTQVPTLSVVNPGPETTGQSFNETVNISGYSVIPSLQWGATTSGTPTSWTAVPSGDVTITQAVFPVTVSTSGTWTIYVRDANNTSIIANSGPFTVQAASQSTGAPIHWGTYGYPNPGQGQTCDQGANFSPGGFDIPFGTATQNFVFWKNGGTQSGATVPGLGIWANVHNTWVDGDGFLDPFSNGWPFEGGPFAPSTGMIPLQGICTCNDGSGHTSWSSSDVLAGSVDSTFQGYVTSWANAGYSTIIYRLDWEFPIGTINQLQQADIPTRIQVWQHVYNVMHAQAAASGVTIMVGWNPLMINYMYPISTSYPGNAYCDIQMIDVYCGLGVTDLQTWPGYANLVCGSTAQLNGGTAGQTASNQLALIRGGSNWTTADVFYHFCDFPGSTTGSPNGRSAVSASGTSFGNESAWGVMDAIWWAKVNNKPLGFPEAGYWTDGQGGGNPATSSGQPNYNVDCNTSGFANTVFAPYLKSRIAYAQSIGVTVHHVSWNMYDPNDPYALCNTSGVISSITPATVQSINTAFAGTGTKLIGFTY